MKVTEEMLIPILREIDAIYYRDKLITSEEADDLCRCISTLRDKSINESNIQNVIQTLRGFKTVIDSAIVSKVINMLRREIGQYA